MFIFDMNELPKPHWIKAKAPISEGYLKTKELISKYNLNTVCFSAACPNIGECWSKKHATVMIMGSTCTRSCTFCNVKTGIPDQLNPHEAEDLAIMAGKLGLQHIVITSVDRDDLIDGGANHFAKCVNMLKLYAPATTIEILTPDFRGKPGALETLVASNPDVYNHNIETVPRLHKAIRPSARYFHSINLLYRVKEMNSNIFTKSGLMVGLGESKEEILQVMDDLRAADIDFLTIGQYLRPSKQHRPVDRYVTPQEFQFYEDMAKLKGFLMVASGPLVRSSYHADEGFKTMQSARLKNNYHDSKS